MSTFFKFFYEFFMAFITAILSLIKDFFVDVWTIINVKRYSDIFANYMRDFMWYEWLFAILTIIIVVALIVLAGYFIVISIKSAIKKHRLRMDKNALIEQVEALNDKVLRLLDEKDQIMAMQVSKLGVLNNGASSGEEEKVSDGSSRFAKLTAVDKEFNFTPVAFTLEQNFDLPQLIQKFLGYSNNTLHLYYNAETIRCFIAGMASSRLIILEGISGTGKTSLPYAWGKFLGKNTTIVPVQPSWRDKTELVGYFNEFTKRFNETDFLKSIYESTYREDIGFVVLDEMNLARIEYYFASVLSILELPDKDEWTMEIVGDSWESDPIHLINGRIRFPSNVWFVGTANQDDSTFTITDKVYDRAIPIQLNSKGKPFDIEPCDEQPISLNKMEQLFADAKTANPLNPETMKKFDKLDDFIIENFKLAFGNRILKQINDFVPVYIACGGTELDGLDFILTYKILRKLEGLNISFIQDNLKATINQIESLFGKRAFPQAKAYLGALIKNS